MKKNNGLIFSTSLLMMVVTLSGCGDVQEEVKVEESVVRPVKTFTVTRVSESKTWVFPSTIKAYKSANLSFERSGTLVLLNVTKGQEVKKGSLIAQIDDRDFRIQLASSKASYNQALKAYERAKTLANKKVISKSQFDEIQSTMISAKATLNSDQKSLEDTNIYAPFNGVVSDVFYDQYDNVSGASKVLTFIDTSRFKVKFDVPADTLRDLDKRTNAKSYVILQGIRDDKLSASYEEISLEPNPNSQAYEITMSFVAPEKTVILPGMPATVEIEATNKMRNTILRIPMKAVISSGDEKYVWVVNPETNKANKRNITIKDGIGEFISISSGLDVDDKIITSGASYVSEGMQVSEWEAK